MVSVAPLSRFLSIMSRNAGIAKANRIAAMTITIISSMSVNPKFEFLADIRMTLFLSCIILLA
ncbi:hypothetical protein A7976_02000 [Methylobacillus sp. MM3]|nr:hypothetical protein A7976_02000 [Methylobacillus sp. MM3]